ncbi:MAG TPA: lipoyl(octanoyl) transferase LipB [Pseudomonadales bacterium]|nr:lipoyl(octanoyl) transferase LipB [Pseudomonadales bacterium]
MLRKDLGRTRYAPVFQAMRDFTVQRTGATPDELWLTEHEPVFTQGQAGRAEHVLAPGDIEVVQSDRGGQVTYHGPGQLVVYLMVDVRRAKLSPRGLVSAIEDSIIDLLQSYDIDAANRRDAPGVYVAGAKVASLGLRIKRGCSYHGLALNVNMDLEPFGRINPCGLIGVKVTQLADLGGPTRVDDVKEPLLARLEERLPRV